VINQISIQAVNASTFSSHFRKPLYGSLSFAEYPSLIRGLFGLSPWLENTISATVMGNLQKEYSRVIFIFFDAFGWNMLEHCLGRSPLLQRALRDGVVSKLTAQFPSTTAAHICTIHTGLPVWKSGVYEWIYYEPSQDEIIAPLLFSLQGDIGREVLKKRGFGPTPIFPEANWYRSLSEVGIESHIYQNQEYSATTPAIHFSSSANKFPFAHYTEGLSSIGDTVVNAGERIYQFIYIDNLDSSCHKYGPNAEVSIQTAMEVLANIDKLIVNNKCSDFEKTVLVLSADHGQVEVNAKKTVYIDKEIPQSKEWFLAGARGDPLVPAGSSRDMFLYVKAEYISEALITLRAKLGGIAEVYLVSDLVEQGIFGPQVLSDRLKERIAPLVILPFEGQAVWWSSEGKYEQNFMGHHGGMTPAEMDIPLIILPL
jgi:predicted AlkP superfamily pyrophosphatase or phosphodiesterase